MQMDKKRRSKGVKTIRLVDANLANKASKSKRGTSQYKEVYDGYIKESTSGKEPLTTIGNDHTVEEICTSLLTDEKEHTLAKLTKPNMVS
jgi:hypothetical protein